MESNRRVFIISAFFGLCVIVTYFVLCYSNRSVCVGYTEEMAKRWEEVNATEDMPREWNPDGNEVKANEKGLFEMSYINNTDAEEPVTNEPTVEKQAVVEAEITEAEASSYPCPEVAKVQTEQEKINEVIKLGEGVSADSVDRITNVLRTNIPDALWNIFLSRSGTIEVVAEPININGSNVNAKTSIKYDESGTIHNITICIVDSNIEKSLVHEFCHTVDVLYNASNLCSKVDGYETYVQQNGAKTLKGYQTYSDNAIQYYCSSSQEFFAETFKVYITSGTTNDEVLDEFYFKVIDALC